MQEQWWKEGSVSCRNFYMTFSTKSISFLRGVPIRSTGCSDSFQNTKYMILLTCRHVHNTTYHSPSTVGIWKGQEWDTGRWFSYPALLGYSHVYFIFGQCIWEPRLANCYIWFLHIFIFFWVTPIEFNRSHCCLTHREYICLVFCVSCCFFIWETPQLLDSPMLSSVLERPVNQQVFEIVEYEYVLCLTIFKV